MCDVIMIGCDLHDESMVLRYARGTGPSQGKTLRTKDRAGLLTWLRELAPEGTRIVFVYEASGQGFGLSDDLQDAGIECHVLAPTCLPHSARSRKTKTDERDAEMLLDQVRSHVLAGCDLPKVWVPSRETRDDRETVRMRLELAEQRTRIKNQIRNQLKRMPLALPEWFSASGEWSKRSVGWLTAVAAGTPVEDKIVEARVGARTALGSLVALYQTLTAEIKRLDDAVRALSQTPRYDRMFRKLSLLFGVGMLTAMVFLTELGDLDRFANRRDLAAYLGLAPSTHETGQKNDRKGHITRQGPSRVRHVLCQAAWATLRSEEGRKKYEQIQRGSKSRSKIAIVALMRQLAVTMWHTARSDKLDQVLDTIDQERTSAQAPRKRDRPFRIAVASAQSG